MAPHFPGQKDNEVIKFLIKKHWMVYVRLIFYTLIMMGLPFLIYFILIVEGGFSANGNNIITLFFLIYIGFALMILFIKWLGEDLDIIIVTNERLISIVQISFMHRTISETDLAHIQDIQHETKGILSQIFRFGMMEIQTAAEKITFCMHDIPNPYETARQIMNLREDHISKK